MTGSERAGRALVEVLESGDEDARQLAGIMLLRNPEPAQAILEAAYRERGSDVVAAVLEDVAGGDDQDFEELKALTESENPVVAERARRLIEERYGGDT